MNLGSNNRCWNGLFYWLIVMDSCTTCLGPEYLALELTLHIYCFLKIYQQYFSVMFCWLMHTKNYARYTKGSFAKFGSKH